MQFQILFRVPPEKCGLVIGKGGETISRISAECDVHCETLKTIQNVPVETTFKITGYAEQIDMAMWMICKRAGIVSI